MGFPGFGVIDLIATWDPEWPRVLEAGWGVFFTVLVGFALLAVAVQMSRAVGPTVQLFVIAAVLGLSAFLADELGVLVFAIAVAAESAAVCALAVKTAVNDRSLMRIVPDRLLMVIAVAGSRPWLVYAFHMFRLNRRELDVVGGT